jgi:hypothetical protein
MPRFSMNRQKFPDYRAAKKATPSIDHQRDNCGMLPIGYRHGATGFLAVCLVGQGGILTDVAQILASGGGIKIECSSPQTRSNLTTTQVPNRLASRCRFSTGASKMESPYR